MEYDNKDIFGMIFFLLSIILFAYMFISPLSHIIFYLDEFFTITLVNFPVGDIIHITAADVHPPLHYLILKFMVKLFSFMGIESNIFIHKIVSIIPYALFLIISATKLRKEYGWFTAGLFVFSIGVMSEFFNFYLTIRMYSWAVLFVVFAFIYAKDALAKKDLKSWLLVSIFSVLSAYTHYFAAISVICLYSFILVHILLKNKEQIKNWFISVVFGILLYSPWILILIDQISRRPCNSIPASSLDLYLSSFGYFLNFNNILNCIIILIIISITVLYLKELNKKEDINKTYILMGMGVYVFTIVLSFIVEMVYKPILVTRYLLPAAAVLWLVISIMIGKIENKKAFIFSFACILLILISGLGATINNINQNNDLETTLNQIAEEDNSILFVPQSGMEMYFLNYSHKVDFYCVHHDKIFGADIDRVHQVFDFNELSPRNLTTFVENHPDNKVYIMYWTGYNLTQTVNENIVLHTGKIYVSELTPNT